jgi:hypothetical protein
MDTSLISQNFIDPPKFLQINKNEEKKWLDFLEKEYVTDYDSSNNNESNLNKSDLFKEGIEMHYVYKNVYNYPSPMKIIFIKMEDLIGNKDSIVGEIEMFLTSDNVKHILIIRDINDVIQDFVALTKICIDDLIFYRITYTDSTNNNIIKLLLNEINEEKWNLKNNLHSFNIPLDTNNKSNIVKHHLFHEFYNFCYTGNYSSCKNFPVYTLEDKNYLLNRSSFKNHFILPFDLNQLKINIIPQLTEKSKKKKTNLTKESIIFIPDNDNNEKEKDLIPTDKLFFEPQKKVYPSNGYSSNSDELEVDEDLEKAFTNALESEKILDSENE